MNNYVTHTQLAIKLFAFETKLIEKQRSKYKNYATSEEIQAVLMEVSNKFEEIGEKFERIDKRLERIDNQLNEISDQMATKEMVQQVLTQLQRIVPVTQ